MTKAKQTAAATAEVKPEDATLAAALQAELAKAAAQVETLKTALEQAEALEQAARDEAKALRTELASFKADSEVEDESDSLAAQYAVGDQPPGEDDEVVAIKSRHGYAFWRAGYHVPPTWTFIRRADFSPDNFHRLTHDRMVVTAGAVPKADA